MDLVIRRQSEQIENNVDGDQANEEYFNHRKWEWGYLRVIACQIRSAVLTYL